MLTSKTSWLDCSSMRIVKGTETGAQVAETPTPSCSVAGCENGYINRYDSDGVCTSETCICVKRTRFKEWCLRDVWEAKILQASPLINDREKYNAGQCSLVIHDTWSNVLPHLRYLVVRHWMGASMWKAPIGQKDHWSLTVTSDHEIMQASVQVPTEDRPLLNVEKVLRNSSLLVIKLGMSGITYREMSSMLIGVLRRRREMYQRPVWVVVDPSSKMNEALKGFLKGWDQLLPGSDKLCEDVETV